MKQVTLVGIDLAKNSFHIHGVNEKGNKIFSRKLSRKELPIFFSNLPSCRIAMEACGSAHYWARKFISMGHEVGLIAAQYVKPFVKTQKNDRNDAEAIVEAALRPSMYYVSVKNVEQQDIQSLHRMRQMLSHDRTALVNQTRGFLAENGLIIAEGIHNFRKQIPKILENANNELSEQMRWIVEQNYQRYLALCDQQKAVEKQLSRFAKQSQECQRLLKVPGVGELVATAFLSSVGDVRSYKNGRQLAAWLGVVPRQHSTGGKPRLLGITKRGDQHLRSIMIHGCRSVILAVSRKMKSGVELKGWENWIANHLEQKGWNITSVALCNKICRVMWHLLAKKEEFRMVS